MENSPLPSLLSRIKFDNSSQKARTNRYQTFLVLSSFSGFLYFVPNILFGIRAPSRRCLGYSKVYCDVRKRWLLAWNQKRHITYSRPHFFCLGKLVDILAPLWFTNLNVADSRTFPFPRCLADSCCLLTHVEQHRTFSVAV